MPTRLFDQLSSNDPALDAFERAFLGASGVAGAIEIACRARLGAEPPYNEELTHDEMKDYIIQCMDAQIHGLTGAARDLAREVESLDAYLKSVLDSNAYLTVQVQLANARETARLLTIGPGLGGGGEGGE